MIFFIRLEMLEVFEKNKFQNWLQILIEVALYSNYKLKEYSLETQVLINFNNGKLLR